jgi:triphosphoribosyl-dephospho-CoA synthetase
MFGSLFKRKDQDKAKDDNAYAPGTEIPYDPSLIQRFKGHHLTLQKLLGDVQTEAEAGQYEDIAESLKTFQRVLQQHVLEENVRLYIYLTKCLADEPEDAEVAGEMKREMGEIGRKVTAFIRHYAEFGVDETNVNKFTKELDTIGSALQDRIHREEESLYTLYLPPEAYAASA